MKSFMLIALLFAAFASATSEHYNTNNRQVYATWSKCDGCKCDHFYLYANEHQTQNPSDLIPPVYLYMSHSSYDNCLFIYSYEWLQTTAPLPRLEISRSGRTAELIASNLTDSSSQTVSISLSWSTKDSDNINNCNCRSVQSYGAESLRINSKSTLRLADITGSVTINGVVHTVSTSTFSYVSGYGEKVITLQHH